MPVHGVAVIDLHLVAVAADGALLLDMDPAGTGRYRLRVDRRLRRAVEPVAEQASPVPGGASATPAAGTGRPEPAATGSGRAARLTPAEIQRRLRSGLSPDVVARLAGVDLATVERWVGPVVAEQHRVLELALGGPVEEGGRRTTATLAALVDAWLPDGTDIEQVQWRAARRPDGAWRVSLQVPGRGRVLTASWLHHEGRTTPASGRARVITFPQD